MRTGVAGWRRQERLVRRLFGGGLEADAETEAETEAEDPEDRLLQASLSETTMAAAGASGASYNAALALTDWCDLRASALSCLGETVAFLGPALATHAGDVVGGLSGILSMEVRPKLFPRDAAARGEVDEEAVRVATECGARVRRAAAFALRRLLEGGGGGAPLALLSSIPEHMRPLHRLLQTGSGGDPDALVRAHARDALASVDDIVGALARGAAGQGGRGMAAPRAGSSAGGGGGGGGGVDMDRLGVTLPAANLSLSGRR
jgi:hypothetical protein